MAFTVDTGTMSDTGVRTSRPEDILGFPVTTLDASACVALILEWIESRSPPRYLVCINPHSVEVAHKDPVFAKALLEADLAVPDGVGIVLASRILGGSIRARVTGSDLFWGLNSGLNGRGKFSVFFMGSTPEHLERIRSRMARDYPGIRVAGVYSPPFVDAFSEEQTCAMVRAVNSVAPDILWIGMTAPKQEKWAWQHRAVLDARFIAPVGAVFDFFSGRVRRPSPFAQQAGLEWLPRWMQEPRRLWRRNLVSSPRFLLRVARARLDRTSLWAQKHA